MTDGDKADLTAVCEFDKSALKKVSQISNFILNILVYNIKLVLILMH